MKTDLNSRTMSGIHQMHADAGDEALEEAERLALLEQEWFEEVGEQWAAMFGRYNTQSEHWVEHVDEIYAQIEKNNSYMQKLKTLNLPRN